MRREASEKSDLVLTSAGFYQAASIIAVIPGLKQAPPGMTVQRLPMGRKWSRETEIIYTGFEALNAPNRILLIEWPEMLAKNGFVFYIQIQLLKDGL